MKNRRLLIINNGFEESDVTDIYFTKILFRWKYEKNRRLLIINNGFDEFDVT